MNKATFHYRCPKCGRPTLKRFRGRRKQNYAHFQCFSCGMGMLSVFDPAEFRLPKSVSVDWEELARTRAATLAEEF